MGEHEFNATNHIVETFEARGIKFDVINRNGKEQILAGFPVDCGPTVMMRFMSRDNDNDVSVRIFGLVACIPNEKRLRAMEACNLLNCKIRHLKFCLDANGSIDVEYDFPLRSPDDSIGEMACEIFFRTMQILDAEYGIFMKALYTTEALDAQEDGVSVELMREIQELRKMINARMAAGASEDDEDEDEDLELDSEIVDFSDDAAC